MTFIDGLDLGASIEFDAMALMKRYTESRSLENTPRLCLKIIFYKTNPKSSLSLNSTANPVSHSSGSVWASLQDNIGAECNLDQFDPIQSIKMRFAPPSRDPFNSNQTVCMSYLEAFEAWTAETCLTSLDDVNHKIMCQCTMIGGNHISVLTDTSRIEGESIQWWTQSGGEAAQEEGSSQASRSIVSVLARFGPGMLILLLGVGGQLIAARKDREDSHADEQARLSKRTFAQRDQELLVEFGKLSGLSRDEVAIRQDELLALKYIDEPSWSYLIPRIHFALGPLNHKSSYHSRLFRFC